MKQLLKKIQFKRINNLEYKLKNATQPTPQQDFESKVQQKKSLYSDVLKLKKVTPQ